MLTRALKNLYKISDLLARLRLARSSSFYHRAHIYHRARIALQDKYLPVRRAMTDIFARKPSLLRRPSAQSLSDTAIYLNLGKRVCSG
jgi:hypothetical protein